MLSVFLFEGTKLKERIHFPKYFNTHSAEIPEISSGVAVRAIWR